MPEFKFGDVVMNGAGACRIMFIAKNERVAFETEDTFTVNHGEICGFIIIGLGADSSYPDGKTGKIVGGFWEVTK